ncbi:MAG: dihydrodipicolinate synthase family protein [Ardenticatenaceae bacterium]|nr:dihydrodipicolinate synthase family protein [Ardenticatenaceae bacterium]
MDKITQLKQRLKHGVTPAMATPIDTSGYAVHGDVVPLLVDFLRTRGVRGLFIGGTTGEGILLSMEDRGRLLETVLDCVDGTFPILAHVGGNTTRDTITLATHAAAKGAAAVVVITPWYFGMDDTAMLAYFEEVAAAVPDTPVMIYDIPQAAVNGVTPALLAKIQDHIPNFAGLKCSRTDIQVIRALLDTQRDDLIFLAGNEAIALGSLALGADGMISGLSTAVPEPFVALTAAFGEGDLAEARRIQQRINQMLALQPPGRRIGGIKRLLQERGVPVGDTIPPRAMPDGGVWEKMRRHLGLNT